jgi:hypothetical protein
MASKGAGCCYHDSSTHSSQQNPLRETKCFSISNLLSLRILCCGTVYLFSCKELSVLSDSSEYKTDASNVVTEEYRLIAHEVPKESRGDRLQSTGVTIEKLPQQMETTRFKFSFFVQPSYNQHNITMGLIANDDSLSVSWQFSMRNDEPTIRAEWSVERDVNVLQLKKRSLQGNNHYRTEQSLGNFFRFEASANDVKSFVTIKKILNDKSLICTHFYRTRHKFCFGIVDDETDTNMNLEHWVALVFCNQGQAQNRTMVTLSQMLAQRVPLAWQVTNVFFNGQGHKDSQY